MGQTRIRVFAAATVASAALSAAAVIALAGSASADTSITTTTTASTSAAQSPVGTVTVDQTCYVNTAAAAAKVTITGSGWTPGDTIAISDTLQSISATATAGSSGTFTVTVPAPVVDPDTATEISDKVAAYDEGTASDSTTTMGPTAYSDAFLTTNYAVIQSGNRTNASKKTTFNLSGFTAGHKLYAHYLSRAGKLLGTASIGSTSGACGLRRVQTVVPRGSHGVQFDASRRYSKRTNPSFVLALKF